MSGRKEYLVGPHGEITEITEPDVRYEKVDVCVEAIESNLLRLCELVGKREASRFVLIALNKATEGQSDDS